MYYPIKEAQRSPSNYINKFKYYYAEPALELPRINKTWNITSFVSKVDGAISMWQARQAIEDAFTLALAAESDEAFEEAWANILAVEERNGFTDEAFEDINKYFREVNGDKFEDLKNWKYE